jgi:hypothetical protein
VRLERAPSRLPDVARRISRLLAAVAPRRAGGDAEEEGPVRGQGSEPVELRPGVSVREEARMAEIERWAWRRMRAMRAFYTHLTVFVGINFLLFLIDSSTSGPIWFYVPFLAWGFLLSLHGLHAYDLLPWTTDGWEQRKVRELVIAKLRAEREFER